MAKKYLRSDDKCPQCGSFRGPCNMHKPTIIEPSFIGIEGHCQDCGYSFTRVFELVLVDTMDRK